MNVEFIKLKNYKVSLTKNALFCPAEKDFKQNFNSDVIIGKSIKVSFFSGKHFTNMLLASIESCYLV